MKKKILCLMIAGLSLIAIPYQANAGSLIGKEVKTEIPVAPVMTPKLEKKVNEFKKNHPELFSKKDKSVSDNSSADAKKAMGGVLIISGGALLVIILILILLL